MKKPTSKPAAKKSALLTAQEAAAEMRCSLRDVRKMIRDHSISSVQIGRKMLIPAKAVQHYIASHPVSKKRSTVNSPKSTSGLYDREYTARKKAQQRPQG